MNTTQTPERRLLRPAALMAALSALGLTFTLMVGPALATHVDPELFQGNPTCGELGNFDHEFKVQPVTNGLKDDPNSNFAVTLTIAQSANGPTLAFDANMDVQAVFVKGGPGGNLYDYGAGEDEDSGLHAPGNDQGTAVSTPPWSGLSHVSFCFGDVEESEEASTEESTEASTEASVEESTEASVEESVEASVEQSVEASAEASVEASVEGSVLGGTGTPAPSTPDTALGSDNGPSPLPTIIFGAILLASLAALAWVNVQTVRTRS
jgi:hypothetical protein